MIDISSVVEQFGFCNKDAFLDFWVLQDKKPLELQKLLIKHHVPVGYTTVRDWLQKARGRLPMLKN